MRLFLALVSLTALLHHSLASLPPHTHFVNKTVYLQERESFIEKNNELKLGADLELSQDEEKLCHILCTLKRKEKERTAGKFPPAHSLLDEGIKQMYEESPMMPYFYSMPKFGILHGHFEGMIDFNFFVQKTYDDNCYVNLLNKNLAIFPPGYHFEKNSPWRRTVELRKADPQAFDQAILDSITMTNGWEESGEGELAWVKFQSIFSRIGGLLWYRPILEEYFSELFNMFNKMNIQYYDMRYVPGSVYDFVGENNETYHYSIEEETEFYLKIRDTYKKKYPEIVFKLLPTSPRSFDDKTVYNLMLQILDLRVKYPDFVVGYDLVGEEDGGHETIYYLDDVININNVAHDKYHSDLPFFFHDGESAHTGNMNVFDAVLMNSKRIAHGFNIWRYPLLKDRIKNSKIPLEVCPISNQLLKLVKDLRLHPAAGYMYDGVQITINPDDPGVLSYPGVHYDYYAVYTGWDMNLKNLKKVIMNSLEFSNLQESEREQARKIWEKRWTSWVKNSIHLCERTNCTA